MSMSKYVGWFLATSAFWCTFCYASVLSILGSIPVGVVVYPGRGSMRFASLGSDYSFSIAGQVGGARVSRNSQSISVWICEEKHDTYSSIVLDSLIAMENDAKIVVIMPTTAHFDDQSMAKWEKDVAPQLETILASPDLLSYLNPNPQSFVVITIQYTKSAYGLTPAVAFGVRESSPMLPQIPSNSGKHTGQKRKMNRGSFSYSDDKLGPPILVSKKDDKQPGILLKRSRTTLNLEDTTVDKVQGQKMRQSSVGSSSMRQSPVMTTTFSPQGSRVSIQDASGSSEENGCIGQCILS